MMLPIVLAAFSMSYRHALMPGFLPLSMTTARGEIAATALRITTRWSACFLIALMVGAVLIHFLTPRLFTQFIHLEYLLVLFLGIVHLLNLTGKHEQFRNFIYNKRWIYSLGMLQGFSTLGNITAIYSNTADIPFTVLLTSCLVYGLTFVVITSAIAIGLGLLAHSGHKARTALVIVLSVICITLGIIHFFFNT